MINQKDFVERCQGTYAELLMDPAHDDEFEKAHYPLPRDQSDSWVWLHHNDHQIQGLIQSEEVHARCFFSGDAKRFLMSGPFVDDWFGLWDLYDKWAGVTKLPDDHGERTSRGILNRFSPKERRKRAQAASRVMIASSTFEERSERAKRAKAHLTYDELLKVSQAGRDVAKKVRSKAVLVTDTRNGEVYLFPSTHEAARQLNLNQSLLCKVANGERRQHLGHMAQYIEGPNPFY